MLLLLLSSSSSSYLLRLYPKALLSIRRIRGLYLGTSNALLIFLVTLVCGSLSLISLVDWLSWGHLGKLIFYKCFPNELLLLLILNFLLSQAFLHWVFYTFQPIVLGKLVLLCSSFLHSLLAILLAFLLTSLEAPSCPHWL